MAKKGQSRATEQPESPSKIEKQEQRARRLRRGTFQMEFKKGFEDIPDEVSGPIVGMFQLTRHSYEIIWLEEDEPQEKPPAEA